MLDHVLNLGNQLSADLVKSDNFPKFNYDRILVVGMGGSGVAGDVLKLILNKYSRLDIEVHKTYKITHHSKSDCIASSNALTVSSVFPE